MDEPYDFMLIERGTRNTYGGRSITEALERAETCREFNSRTERYDVYALVQADPRDRDGK